MHRSLLDHVAPDVFDQPIQSDRLERYLAEPTNRLLLAWEPGFGGQPLVVGQCAAVLHHHPDKPTELCIDELGTASTHRRRGIARRLLTEMIAWGRELGCQSGWLATELDNGPARALYNRLFDEQAIVFYEFDLDMRDS